MRTEQLRDAVSGICMTEDMKSAVIRNVKERTEESGRIQTGKEQESGEKQDNWIGKSVQEDKAGNGKGKKKGDMERMQQDRKARSSKRSKDHGTGWRKGLAAAAAVLVVIGIAAVPVRAFVNSLVRERMEEMPQEEKETYVDTVKEQKVAADSFSRAYTKQEVARYQELAKKYQEGTFPAQALPQAESEEEAAGYELCYLVPTATFCLPERDLTDEEMLEIIDFFVKRDYAYSESYAKEHAEQIAEEEAQEQAAIDKNVESGGITEQEAIEIGRQKLADIFGMTVDGFEQNAYYNEPEEGKRADYCVSWSNNIEHKFYYFNIDAQDGHLVRASYSGTGLHDGAAATEEEALGRIPQLQEAAAETMRREVGAAYDKVYVYYLNYEDGSVGIGAVFYFVMEDQNAYGIAYTWNGILHEIEEKDISTLKDGEEINMWDGEEDMKATAVFRELEE